MEGRYAHLLQPIRELIKNWDMDLAAELNDYLEELDDMCITLDEGETQLNFAEAALLIQGSACIYSKKVEMLHNLVFQTLDYIRDRKNKQSKEAVGRDDVGTAVGHGHNDDSDDDDFCELDIKTTDWVDKPEASARVKVVPLPPVSLIPPESRDKHKYPLISAKGEVVCSQKDFRINIFLPGHEDLIDLMLPSATSTPRQDAVMADDHESMVDLPEQSFLPAAAVEVQQEVDEYINRQQAPSREQQQVVSKDAAARPAVWCPNPTLPVFNVLFQHNLWPLHDPYATLGADTPFQPGKNFKVPSGLDDKGKRKRQAASPLQDFRTWFKQIYDLPERKLREGPACIDLGYIHRLRRKLSRFKRTNKEEVEDHALEEDLLEPEEAETQEKRQDPMDGLGERDLLDADEDNMEQEAFAAGDDVSGEDELTYEELVKLRVEQMMGNCREYTQETALSHRVQKWEGQIRPKLLWQEARAPLDIHEYSSKIVSALGGIGRRLAFSSIVHGLDSTETCRFLLASLHLANEYTVDIDSAGSLEESVDSMGLTLLSGLPK
ncbi:condensin-2 complex subunit H2 isoform X1 [Syngnathus scovelli]|uniref:condensin-2 complex subunit H2 isoform X1 n=1 Tax=Syngnathus scovelli TaxID=161590 RepID=UPI00210F7D32|nr:condensin-2 complex subunit H2 isoform X1 [Syngnathus scovelli]